MDEWSYVIKSTKVTKNNKCNIIYFQINWALKNVHLVRRRRIVSIQIEHEYETINKVARFRVIL